MKKGGIFNELRKKTALWEKQGDLISLMEISYEYPFQENV